MTDPVLRARDVCKSFGALRVSDAVSLDLYPGEIHALIGPNGAGKSTLIQQLAGSLPPDSGQILMNGQDITGLGTAARAQLGLARSFQVSAVLPEFTVLQNVLLAVEGAQGPVYRFFGKALRQQALAQPALAEIARVGLSGRVAIPAGDLAHGERRRLEIAMALALSPRLFLLDEPMAGLGPEGTAELTALLSDLRHAAPILLVEHDMTAVFALADRISVLVEGRIIATGPPDEIRANPAVQRAYLGEEVGQ